MDFPTVIDDVDSREYTLAVFNREVPEPIVNLLERTFESESVDVREAGSEPAAPANLVQLLDETGRGVTSVALEEVRDQLLMVNSDVYVTGTRPLDDVGVPSLMVTLDDTRFSVAGKSKLLLIHASRFVESLALETRGGVLHAGFQYLSRISDERGTERAYRRLGDTDVDVHVYGVPDWGGPPAERLTVHPAAENSELQRAWFVVHDGDGCDDRKAALVATETGPNEYDGFWTFRPDTVDEVLDYLDDEYA